MSEPERDTPHVPAPSLWPIGFAIGVACILVGLVVSVPALIVGALITLVFGFLWMRDLFAKTFASETMAEWAELFEGTDACVAPVLTPSEAATHPHLQARQTYVTHHGVTQPAPAPRFAGPPE